MTMIFSRDQEGASVLVGDTDRPLTEGEREQSDLRAVRADADARVEMTARRLDSRVGAFGQLGGRHRKIND